MTKQTAYLQSKDGKAQRKRRGFYYICANPACAREFYVTPSRVAYQEKRGAPVKYCSMACRSIGYAGEGNPMWGKKHTPAAIKKFSEHPNRRHFDPGKDNPNAAKHGDQAHADSTHKRWRREIIKKHGAKCAHCGYNRYAPVLELHHRDGNKNNPSAENYELLCPTCHEEEHYLAGTGKYAKGHGHKIPAPQ